MLPDFLLYADADASGLPAFRGGQLIASFRYNPIKYQRKDRDLMLVEVPLSFTATELGQLEGLSSGQVLSLLQNSLEKLHQRLRAGDSLLTSQHLSLVQFEKHSSPPRGDSSVANVEKKVSSDARGHCEARRRVSRSATRIEENMS